MFSCISENNTSVSDIISKQPESSKDDAASNEPSQEMTSRDLSDTVPFLENDPSRKHFEESFILLCCKDSIRTYATKSIVHVSVLIYYVFISISLDVLI